MNSGGISEMTPVENFAEHGTVANWRRLVVICSIALAAIIFPAFYIWWRTGTLKAIPAYLAGAVLDVQRTIDLGAVKPEVELTVNIPMRNIGSDVCRVLGVKKSCNCLSVGSFPVELAASELKDISVKFRPPPSNQPFEHEITLFTDADGMARVPVRIVGYSQ